MLRIYCRSPLLPIPILEAIDAEIELITSCITEGIRFWT